MTHDEQRLLRHLVLAVLAKLIALTALWWWLVHDTRTPVTTEQAAMHLGTPPAAVGDTP